MNVFYIFTFVIYFMFIVLVLTTVISGLKGDSDKFMGAMILTIFYFIFVIIYTIFCLR